MVVVGAAVYFVLAGFARGPLSGADLRMLDRSLTVVNHWCIARRPPAGGRPQLAAAVDELVFLSRTKPRRRTEFVDSDYSTVREVVTTTTRSLDGTCQRTVPEAGRLRAEVADLATSREGSAAPALTERQMRERLSRIATAVDVKRVPGPRGVASYGVRLRKGSDPPLDGAVVLGDDAVRKARRFPRPLVAGVSNQTAMHPQDGVDTALILDSAGLRGAPYTMDLSTPMHSRPVRQRRGDLHNAVEWALVGEVSH